MIGELVDRIHVEPLHLKNNACALAHRYLLNEVVTIANLPASVTCFDKVPTGSPFAKYVSTLRQHNLSTLAKQIIRWFNDNKEGKTFDYRFTVKE